MGDKNQIRTLGDYSTASYEGYRNTIDLPIGNNVVPLRSDTIRLVQNGCSFHGLRFEDPNQYLKDFLKLVDSLDLDGENKERMRLRLFQFSFRDQDSNWLEQNPEQAFVDYASLRTNEAGGLVSKFMASQDARLSKFKADFKQKQSEMTNKINTIMKAITDQIVGTLPSDTVKNLRLSDVLVLSARSYRTIDPQCSSHPSNSINAIKAHFKEATISQTNLQQPKIETEPPQPEEPKPTLKDEF
nr:MAK10-like protein [Tanacetum cinerariifolium]